MWVSFENWAWQNIYIYICFHNICLHFLGEQFVAQNRGINSGKDIPRDILEMIYDSIKGEPFKIPDESYLKSSVIITRQTIIPLANQFFIFAQMTHTS